MHIALVGAGALGRVYGVRLTARRAASVTFVIRPAARAPTGPMRIERVGSADRHEISSPSFSTSIPTSAEIVVLAVRVDNLDDSLEDQLRAAPQVPIVSLTPLLPGASSRLRHCVADRLVSAIPGTAAHTDPYGVVRYWLPRVAPTLVDDLAASTPAVRALVDALREAGIPARFARDVDRVNRATIATFLPLVLLLDACGGTAQQALSSPGQVRLAIEAVEECAQLAAKMGEAPAWARVLARFLGPRSLGVGVALARRAYPESVRFVEGHFGNKTRAQNVMLAAELVSLARESGVKHQALSALFSQLENRKQ